MPLDNVGKETGWLSKWAFQRDSLKADGVGREAMEDGYIQTAKIADSQVTYAKLANAIMFHVGVYGLDQYDLALYG